MSAVAVEQSQPTSPPVENHQAHGDAPKPDLGPMLPGKGDPIMVAGHQCHVRRIKSRELLMLIRILSAGLGDATERAFDRLKLSSGDPEQLQSQMVAILTMALPNAIDEFGQFMLGIVDPVDRSAMPEVKQEMANPDPDVLLDVIGIMVQQEAEDFSSLMGKAQAWIAHLKKANLAIGSSGPSPAHST